MGVNTFYLSVEQICDGYIIQEDEDTLTLRCCGREIAHFTLHATREAVQQAISEHELAGAAA